MNDVEIRVEKQSLGISIALETGVTYPLNSYTFTTRALKVVISDYGATILSISFADRNGYEQDVTLGYAYDIKRMVDNENKAYMGCIAGLLIKLLSICFTYRPLLFVS